MHSRIREINDIEMVIGVILIEENNITMYYGLDFVAS